MEHPQFPAGLSVDDIEVFMAVHELDYPAANGIDRIRAWVHTPMRVQPVAAIQLIHGYGEHLGRYPWLIPALLDRGVVVAGADHVGHGQTAAGADRWGLSGSTEPQTLIDDQIQLRQRLDELAGPLPVVVFGHSLGSLIAREFVAQQGERVHGAVFCGTLGPVDGFERAHQHARSDLAEHGPDAPSEALLEVFGPFAAHFGQDPTSMAWDAADPGVVHDYENDPLSLATRLPSTALTMLICGLYAKVSSAEWASRVPGALPCQFISGRDDPAGGFGSGVEQVAAWLRQAGVADVAVDLVPGARHEVFNEAAARHHVNAVVGDFVARVAHR